jgi:hypothetical protein
VLHVVWFDRRNEGPPETAGVKDGSETQDNSTPLSAAAGGRWRPIVVRKIQGNDAQQRYILRERLGAFLFSCILCHSASKSVSISPYAVPPFVACVAAEMPQDEFPAGFPHDIWQPVWLQFRARISV